MRSHSSRPLQQALLPCKKSTRKGAALMLCLFVVFMVMMWLVQILNTMTSDLATIRNTIDYERALYLANAGVHEVASQLELNSAWRGIISDGSYPNDNTYTATAADGDAPNSIVVTSTGVSGEISRTVTAILEL